MYSLEYGAQAWRPFRMKKMLHKVPRRATEFIEGPVHPTNKY